MPPVTTPVCFKCRGARSIVCSRECIPEKSYCAPCFLSFVTKIFRETLFRNCKLPSSDEKTLRPTVVICVSGSCSSMSMLHMLGLLRVQNHLRGGKGKIEFNFQILHAKDESTIKDAPNQIIQCARMSYKEAMRHFNGKDEADLADVPLFDPSSIHFVELKPFVLQFENLFANLQNTPLTPSDKDEFSQIAKRNGLISAALSLLPKQTGPIILLLGSNAFRVAVNALESIVYGRGLALPQVCSFRTVAFNSVVIMRPMTKLLPKECVFYNLLMKIPWASIAPTSVPLSSPFRKRRISITIENFLLVLSQNFRSTVFNVVQMVGKLSDSSLSNCVLSTNNERSRSRDDMTPTETGEDARSERAPLSRAAQLNFEEFGTVARFLAENRKLVSTCIFCGFATGIDTECRSCARLLSISFSTTEKEAVAQEARDRQQRFRKLSFEEMQAAVQDCLL